MKITKEHYEYMKKEIEPLITKAKEHRKFIVSEGKAKDIETRLRWDCFHAAKLDKFACDTLYNYLNDDHIDTALKNIIKELGI